MNSVSGSLQGLHQARVQADIAAADAVRRNGTPDFFIGKVVVSGAQPLPSFEQARQQEIAARSKGATTP